MWRPYRDAISEALPNTSIVIDPPHAIKIAESGMDSVRKKVPYPEEMKSTHKKDARLFLSSVFKLSNDELDGLELYLRVDKSLEKSYFIVKELMAFYWIRDYEYALDYLSKWELEVLSSGIKEMHDILNTVQNWLPYIMNFFIHRITNGRTEGKNHLLRVIDRIGFHYGLTSMQVCIYSHDRNQELIKWLKYQDKKSRTQDLAA